MALARAAVAQVEANLSAFTWTQLEGVKEHPEAQAFAGRWGQVIFNVMGAEDGDRRYVDGLIVEPKAGMVHPSAELSWQAYQAAKRQLGV